MTNKTEELAWARMGASFAQPDLVEAFAHALQQLQQDQLLRGLVSDELQRSQSQQAPAGTVRPVDAGPIVSGNDGVGWGWRDAPPLKPPEGINVIDQMCEAENRRWRAEREAEFAKLKRGEKP